MRLLPLSSSYGCQKPWWGGNMGAAELNIWSSAETLDKGFQPFHWEPGSSLKETSSAILCWWRPLESESVRSWSDSVAVRVSSHPLPGVFSCQSLCFTLSPHQSTCVTLDVGDTMGDSVKDRADTVSVYRPASWCSRTRHYKVIKKIGGKGRICPFMFLMSL